jgi:hydrogenase nickel incorporation protein HypA/HybF
MTRCSPPRMRWPEASLVMHELAICQALMNQVDQIAFEQRAMGVAKIVLQIGPLSGVEPQLLEQAFPLASAGSLAESCVLEVKQQVIEVECSKCGQHSVATPNRLVCAECGEWRTRLISGDEMLLERVELICDEEINHV